MGLFDSANGIFEGNNKDGKLGDWLSNLTEGDGILGKVLGIGEQILNIGGISAEQKKSNKTEQQLYHHLQDAGISFPDSVPPAHIMHGYNHNQKQKAEDTAMLVGAIDRWGDHAADFFSNKIKSNVIRGDEAILGGQVKEWVQQYVKEYDPESRLQQEKKKPASKEQAEKPGEKIVSPGTPQVSPNAPSKGGEKANNTDKPKQESPVQARAQQSETILGLGKTTFYIAAATAVIALAGGLWYYKNRM